MTTISNLTIVVQQGDSARDAQNIRNPAVESSHLAAAQQQKEVEQKKTIQESDNSEKIKADQESAEGRSKEEKEKKKKKKADEKPVEDDPEGRGGLLNTVA